MAVETDSTAQLQLQAFDAGAHPWSYGISLARLVTSNSAILLGNDKKERYNKALRVITFCFPVPPVKRVTGIYFQVNNQERLCPSLVEGL